MALLWFGIFEVLMASSLVNAFGYWQEQSITNATATYLDDLQQAFARIQHVSGNTDEPELWNGETGWPSDGMCNARLHIQADVR